MCSLISCRHCQIDHIMDYSSRGENADFLQETMEKIMFWPIKINLISQHVSNWITFIITLYWLLILNTCPLFVGLKNHAAIMSYWPWYCTSIHFPQSPNNELKDRKMCFCAICCNLHIILWMHWLNETHHFS